MVNKRAALIKNNSGQSLPMVIVLGALLSILSASLLTLFRTYVHLGVKQGCILQKQELATMALEHSIYQLQKESNWFNLPITNFHNYSHEFTTDLGNFSVHIVNGNLFLTDLSSPGTSPRQAQDEYKTIGIKVKTKPQNCTGAYYAVVQRKSLGGPLISKGKINLPCTDAKYSHSNLYWGDIYSSNTNTGYCRIPSIEVAKGQIGLTHHAWLPKVYSKADIYTAVGYTGGRTGSYIFASSYHDMSPTAHCHPYSPFAVVPDMDLDYFKNCLLYTSPSPRDRTRSRMPSSA